jgi:hypothetical protein
MISFFVFAGSVYPRERNIFWMRFLFIGTSSSLDSWAATLLVPYEGLLSTSSSTFSTMTGSGGMSLGASR